MTEGRDHFRRFDLHHQRVIPAGTRGTYLFLWDDDRVNTTLLLELHRRGVKVENEGICLLLSDTPPRALRALLEEIARDGLPDAITLAEQVPNTIVEKYDLYLTPELRRQQYAARRIRTDETLAVVREIVGETHD